MEPGRYCEKVALEDMSLSGHIDARDFGSRAMHERPDISLKTEIEDSASSSSDDERVSGVTPFPLALNRRSGHASVPFGQNPGFFPQDSEADLMDGEDTDVLTWEDADAQSALYACINTILSTPSSQIIPQESIHLYATRVAQILENQSQDASDYSIRRQLEAAVPEPGWSDPERHLTSAEFADLIALAQRWIMAKDMRLAKRKS
ncbi:hypothetical protein BZG36_02724 [Bifiguratus adelaidae]|uniref:Uncharacterized protein n=1 Tax=Bifiguratus adelaidae TaxID=1938954 RepID=A0A261XYL5_9FUNG|nr:hypothetical protein BZG36_02724 [Bifiguratus adelaidae]